MFCSSLLADDDDYIILRSVLHFEKVHFAFFLWILAFSLKQFSLGLHASACVTVKQTHEASRTLAQCKYTIVPYPFLLVARQFLSSSPPGHCAVPSHRAARDTHRDPTPPHRNACMGQRSPVPSDTSVITLHYITTGIQMYCATTQTFSLL